MQEQETNKSSLSFKEDLTVERKVDRKGATFFRLTFDTDPAIVGHDDVFDNGKSQSGTPQFSASTFVNTVKTLKQAV